MPPAIAWFVGGACVTAVSSLRVVGRGATSSTSEALVEEALDIAVEDRTTAPRTDRAQAVCRP
jgi:hypothetical protein